MVASLVFDAVLSVPPDQRSKPVTILCTDTRVEIPAISEGVESTLDRMRRFSQQEGLNIEALLLKPPPEQSFWVSLPAKGARGGFQSGSARKTPINSSLKARTRPTSPNSPSAAFTSLLKR